MQDINIGGKELIITQEPYNPSSFGIAIVIANTSSDCAARSCPTCAGLTQTPRDWYA